MPYSKNTTRPQEFSFSDPSCCNEGVLINFSGVPMQPHVTYTVFFDWYSTLPSSPIIEFKPQTYSITPVEQSNNHVVSTFFRSVTNFNYDNSTKNVIGVRVYDNSSRFIYENIGIIKCGDTCTEEGQPRFEFVASRFPTPTPSVTATLTPTPTITPTISLSATVTPTPTATPTPSPSLVCSDSNSNYNNEEKSSVNNSQYQEHKNWGLLRIISQYG
tara:strand:+ start:2867 stop:3514 length:648 start_codon:yes stop_codon:yes gene_type:complete